MTGKSLFNNNLSESLQNLENLNNTALEIFKNEIQDFKSFAFEMFEEHDEEVIPYLKSLYATFYYFPEFEYYKSNRESPQEIDNYNLDEIYYEWVNYFQLEDEDFDAINVANKVMKKVLKLSSITPKNIIAIGHYLEALNRLPEVKSGTDICIDIHYENGNADFRESKTYSFMLNEDSFQIDVSGHQYEASVGGDSIDYDSWHVERSGERDCKLNLENLESEIVEFLKMGASISSEITLTSDIAIE